MVVVPGRMLLIDESQRPCDHFSRLDGARARSEATETDTVGQPGAAGPLQLPPRHGPRQWPSTRRERIDRLSVRSMSLTRLSRTVAKGKVHDDGASLGDPVSHFLPFTVRSSH